jgi:hypothetical protein
MAVQGTKYGTKKLQDPTCSGIGDQITTLLTNKPSNKKEVKQWEEELEILYDKYNDAVGFLAFGKDEEVVINPDYNRTVSILEEEEDETKEDYGNKEDLDQ